jgi:hypothetical protein
MPKNMLRNTAIVAVAAAIIATFVSTDQDVQAAPMQTTTVQLAAVSQLSEPGVRPAFGFELERSTRADVMAWSKGSAVDCDVVAMGRRMVCVLNDGELSMRFDAEGRLVGAESRRILRDRDDAMAELTQATAHVAAVVGDATDVVESDCSRAFQRTESSFSYAGYNATIALTNLGSRGLQLRERYIAR